MFEDAESKELVRSWLFELLSKLEKAKKVEATKTEHPFGNTELDITFEF